jgi:hypothetical protein
MGTAGSKQRVKRQKRWRREPSVFEPAVRLDDHVGMAAPERRCVSAPRLDLERVARSDSDSRVADAQKPVASWRSAPVEVNSPRYYAPMPVLGSGGTHSSELIFRISMPSNEDVRGAADVLPLGHLPTNLPEPVLLERVEGDNGGSMQFRSRVRSNSVHPALSNATPRRQRADTWDNGPESSSASFITSARATLLRDSLTPHGSRVSEAAGFDQHGYVVTPYLQCTMSGVIYASAELQDGQLLSGAVMPMPTVDCTYSEPQSVGSA